LRIRGIGCISDVHQCASAWTSGIATRDSAILFVRVIEMLREDESRVNERNSISRTKFYIETVRLDGVSDVAIVTDRASNKKASVVNIAQLSHSGER